MATALDLRLYGRWRSWPAGEGEAIAAASDRQLRDAPPALGGTPLGGDGQFWKRLVIVMILSPVKNSSLTMKIIAMR